MNLFQDDGKTERIESNRSTIVLFWLDEFDKNVRLFNFINCNKYFYFYLFQQRKNFEMSYPPDEISIGFMSEKVNIVSIISCIKNTQRGATIHTCRNWYQMLFLFSLLTSELFNVLRQSVGRVPSLVCHPRRRYIVLFPVDPLQRVGWRRWWEAEEVKR